jgi:hypothetical protein
VLGLPRGSARLIDAVRRWEPHPGAVAWSLRIWADAVRRPHYIHYRSRTWDFPHEVRETLEAALCALPTRAARELRELVQPLDDIYLANTSNDPFAARGDPWWKRRL